MFKNKGKVESPFGLTGFDMQHEFALNLWFSMKKLMGITRV
jgi:hypothetical protein